MKKSDVKQLIRPEKKKFSLFSKTKSKFEYEIMNE